MPRYIDADALKLDIDLSKGSTVLDLALSVIRSVKDAPTADVVEVVRCRECKHHRDLYGGVKCERLDGLLMNLPDDFCSYGERKEQT